MSKVYTFGYGGRAPQDIADIAASLGAAVLDIRMNPQSRRPEWNGGRLKVVLAEQGVRYAHIRALGNENYKGGPIKLYQPDLGVRMVQELLNTQPVILLCACREVATCHRATAAELLQERLGVEVVHLPFGFVAGSATIPPPPEGGVQVRLL
jgi:uncharacterized protein (DUF488 family)